MRFLALIYADEAAWDELGAAEREAWYGRYRAFAAEAGAAGVLVDGQELAPTAHATTVRVRDARTLVLDGPYAEAKEALGGFFVLDCRTMEDALDWAARIPGAEHGAVEVRPVHHDPEEAS